MFDTESRPRRTPNQRPDRPANPRMSAPNRGHPRLSRSRASDLVEHQQEGLDPDPDPPSAGDLRAEDDVACRTCTTPPMITGRAATTPSRSGCSRAPRARESRCECMPAACSTLLTTNACVQDSFGTILVPSLYTPLLPPSGRPFWTAAVGWERSARLSRLAAPGCRRLGQSKTIAVEVWDLLDAS